ncbi:MAG: hypothetical protein H6636_06905 [Anaerolineales bacterium]|nr:hypothetical protein [Anaerolineales bacterium]
MSDEHWPPLPPSVINDPTIRDRCFRAFTRLYVRAWNGNTLTPIRLTEDELSTLLQKSRAQMYDLLQEMTSAKLIRWYRDGPHFRITTAFQAPAPFGSISFESGNPDSNPDLSLDFQTRIRESGIPGQVNGHGALNESLIKSDDDDGSKQIHHHHHQGPSESGNPDSETLAKLDQTRKQSKNWLIQAGVWCDEAETLAVTLAENEILRAYNAHLPTRADILGWIVALKNRPDVQKPDAMLARNLKYGRRAPVKLRPPHVCATCQRTEGYCTCPQPIWTYPDELLTHALDPDNATWCCHHCHALPCACIPIPDNETSILSGARSALGTPKSKGTLPDEPPITGWNGLGMSPDQAWQGALGQLQMEMPKATFSAYVRDARFGGYDHGKYTITFPTPYACDWCESRLSSSITRILAGITNNPNLTLEFVHE